MRTFITENFARLSLFIQGCPYYENTLPEQFAVIMTYNGVFLYTFMLVIAVYDRSLFHIIAWTGVAFTSMTVSVLEAYVPLVKNTSSLCTSREVDMPSTDVAIVTFVIVFYLIFDLFMGSRRIWISFFRFTWFLWLYTTTVGSMLYLLLYDMREIAASTVVGAFVGALVATFTTLVVVPNLDTPVMGKVCSFLMVDNRRMR
ncbi:MAG: hypothetical protein JKY23_06025 [Nitrospinaceae bacterium]|nr:hypothetical protein [Nitrospinaceae bacterium]